MSYSDTTGPRTLIEHTAKSKSARSVLLAPCRRLTSGFLGLSKLFPVWTYSRFRCVRCTNGAHTTSLPPHTRAQRRVHLRLATTVATHAQTSKTAALQPRAWDTATPDRSADQPLQEPHGARAYLLRTEHGSDCVAIVSICVGNWVSELTRAPHIPPHTA